MRTLISLLLLFITSAAFAQRSSVTDTRDSTRYPVILIGSTWWFTSDLDFKGAGFANDDCACGRLYLYNEAENACPTGYRLPTEQDWSNLFTSLKGVKKITGEGIFFYNINLVLLDTNLLSLHYCGFSRLDPFSKEPKRQFMECGSYGAYWYRNTKENVFRGVHFSKGDDWIGTVNGDKATGFSIRCIKNAQ